mgnify:CR=1 FL=1
MPKAIALALLAILALTATVGADNTPPPPEEELLPIGLTDEEKTRLHEIGRDHQSTTPPTGQVRNPSEWEPMQGVIVRYPFGISYSLIAEMSEDLVVTTIVASSSEQSYVTSMYQANGVNLSNTDFLIASTNSIWTRDYGPWFIFEESGDLGIVDHIYNRPRPLDDVIPQHIGAAWGLNVYGMDLETTGGNHMSDGLGMSMSTELVYNENPGLSHTQVDSIMYAYLNNDYTVLDYIESGGIHHIDCWAKFLNPTTILVKDVPTSSSSYALLNQRAQQLSQMTSPWGRPYTVVRVYCPYGTAYTNSIILNDKVLVPIFGDAWDDDAIQTYEDAMPGYEVIGFTGSWLDDDAIHCRTMGVPDSNMLFIHHVPLFDTADTLNDYLVQATIRDHSDAGLIMDSLKIYYSIDNGPWQYAMMSATGSPEIFEGHIPAQGGVGQIEYYIKAADNSGRIETHPFIGEPWAHTFSIDLPPDMQLPLTELADSLQPDMGDTLHLPVVNSGAGALEITFSSGDSWLDFDTAAQVLPPGDSIEFGIAVDAAGLACGDHSGSLEFVSNDLDLPTGHVTVDLHIFTPDIWVVEDSLSETLASGDTSSTMFTVANNGPGRLDFTVSCQMFTGLAAPPGADRPAEPIQTRHEINDKGRTIEPIFAASERGSGGPDAYGHSWIDSDESSEVTYDWIDISGVGTAVSLGDDDTTGSIPIGFAFGFYDSVYTELYIGSNGIITFDEPSALRVNLELPTEYQKAMIAPFWDDLDPSKGGAIYYYSDVANERFIVSFEDVRIYYSSTGTGSLDFQVILYPDGRLLLQYAVMDPGLEDLLSCTIGIQNSEYDDGLQVVRNAAYLHDYLAIEINAAHWLSAVPSGGSIEAYGSTDVTVLFDANDMEDGEYAGLISVGSNDPDTPSHQIPATLTVSSDTFVCGDADGSGAGPDIADLVYLVAWMFSDGPPPPEPDAIDVNADGAAGDIADLVYLVTYMFQEGPDLQCP